MIITKTLTMKKTFIIAASSMLMLTLSCKKSTDGNTSVSKQEDGYSADLPKDSMNIAAHPADEADHNAKDYTDRYVGEDGTSALVTFNNTAKVKTISIRSNNKTITTPQTEAFAKGGIYKDFDITIVAKNDSITITQEKNVIHLVKARGQ